MRTFDVRLGMSCRRWISPIGGGPVVFEARSLKWSRAVTFLIKAARAYGAECNLFEGFQPPVSYFVGDAFTNRCQCGQELSSSSSNNVSISWPSFDVRFAFLRDSMSA